MMNPWAEIGHNYHFIEREDIQIIVDMVKVDCKTVIEFATGSGIFPVTLRKSGFEGTYVGTDYADNFLKNAQENNPKETFRKMDLNEPLPVMDKAFEGSVVIHGLEYTDSYFNTLQELKRITSKFIYIDMWQDLVDTSDQIRFRQNMGWHVNNYNKNKFYASLKNLGLEPIVDILNSNQHSKTNRIMRLTIV